MATSHPRPETLLSTFAGYLQTLKLWEDTCSIPPAKVVFRTATDLVNAISVFFLLLAGTNIWLTLSTLEAYDRRRLGLVLT